jgi:regulator of protease activity HflC (stomatin/prohibitin superfamily)
MRIVVREWEQALLHADGRLVEVLGPGRHRRRRWRRTVTTVSTRARLSAVAGQEVLTADAVSVRVSLLVRSRVADTRRWHEAVEDPDSFVYAALQVALREAVAARTLDELLTARTELAAELAGAAAGVADDVGVVLDDVAVRDVMVPPELRRAAAEAATARAHGLAALERARGEVAATRALANAARMLTDNPGLLQLRTLQAVEAGGATVVLSHESPVDVARGTARTRRG